MAMAPDTNDQRLELLQGTLNVLILRWLQWRPQHGHGIGQAIQSDDLPKVETKATKGILRPDRRTVPRLRLHIAGKTNLIGNPYASPVDFATLTRTNIITG